MAITISKKQANHTGKTSDAKAIAKALCLVGLKRNSQSWQDYEKAKALYWQRRRSMGYEEYVRVVCAYLGV
jgi:hypothetical protein